MARYTWLLALPLCAVGLHAQDLAGDASVTVHKPEISDTEQGKRTVQDVTLATSIASYRLRYDIVERPDDPETVTWVKWAPTIGYTPLGLAAPSMALWYNQGFFTWTFDDLNIQSYRAQFRVVHEYGPDAMVEYTWDTPKAKVTARFAMTAGSDKLIFLGRYEPKQEVKTVKLRLMAYPGTFSKPWVRSATTATRTLTEGNAQLDLAQERWVLLEDVCENRPADGSAGLLLGDTSAFAAVTVSSIGGYAEYVDLTLKPDRREFALALYEFPSLPDPERTRDYFRRAADAESEALAKSVAADWDQPLAPLPVDEQRVATIVEREEKLLDRPAETWRPDPAPLDFPWAANLPGPPVKVALLCPRWSAWETMELARRLEMDVKHLYFDSKSALTNPSAWPYRSQTGIGPLSRGVAERHAMRVCGDEGRDVILICGVDAVAIPTRVRSLILEQVHAGKGLMLTGNSPLAGWPKELTATPDDSLVEPALSAMPWDQIPGLREGERGRIGDGPPLRGYRYGEGRVVVFTANIGRYSAFTPINDASEGLDGATDRLLAFSALALLAAAGKQLPPLTLKPDEIVADVDEPFIPWLFPGEGHRDALVRVQGGHDEVVALKTIPTGDGDPGLTIPLLPAGRRYFVDVAIRDTDEACLGYASAVVDVAPEHEIASVALSPSKLLHEAAVPMVDLINGGTLTCSARLEPAPGDRNLTIRWQVRDCFDRLLASETTAVAADGTARAELQLNRPVTVCHQLDLALVQRDAIVAVKRQRFTIPIPYPYDDFTFLMWSYARGEPVIRREDRLCYELGADMMDLCHMRGYDDPGAAREYAISARSGLRLLPYVTRIAGTATEGNLLKPGLFDAAWIEDQRASMQRCSRQASPYRPAAYTLGDENYLARGNFEIGAAAETMAAFRAWLQARYRTIDALNATWDTTYARFDDIQQPMWLDDVVNQERSFAPWFDHKDFLDTAFAELHEQFADCVRNEDPGAKVGWDGLLGYHWQAGYDFHKLTGNLELNQVYTSHSLQAEFVRSLKRPDALTGEWGNAVADNEDGFSAIGWHNLFQGHNSCWWWTSWGCDYIPFNPDTSLSKFGEWYFRAADEIRSGPGKLLVHAMRDHSGIAVWYSQADMFAAKLVSRLAPEAVFAGESAWLDDHRGLLRGLEDLGYQCKHVAAAAVAADPAILSEYRVLCLPLATCLSDDHVAAIRSFVESGGTLIADGRVGLLTGNGVIRQERPLDDLLGVRSPAGRDAFAQASTPTEVQLQGDGVSTHVLETGLKLARAEATIVTDGALALMGNPVGQGRAVLLNVPFRLINALRGDQSEAPALAVLGEVLAGAGVKPYAKLATEDGPARCIEQSLFVEGDLRYLCLEQDVLQPGLPPQQASLTIDDPAFVYDVRAGEQIGNGRVDSWDLQLSRGRPMLFALLPYEVRAVQAGVPDDVKPGEALPLKVMVEVEPGQPRFHVVHVSVYAPGSEHRHRQYSQSIECPAGKGEAIIPFALNDPVGDWRLELRDVASGVRATRSVRVRA